MAKSHGRSHYLALDNPAGSLVSIVSATDKADYEGSADRPETTTFGNDAKRYGVLGLKSGQLSIGGFLMPSSTKIHGRAAVVYVGAYDVSGYFDSGTVTKNVDLPETQTFGDSWKEHGVPGLRDDSMSLEGFHDATASSGSWDVIRAALAASTLPAMSVAYNGYAIGSLVDFGAIATETMSLPGDVNGVNRLTASAKYDNGCMLGVSLHANTAETGTADAASVDETAATADGGYAVIHTTAFSGFTSVTIKVQHSTNDSVWADLASFTAVTAIGSEVIEIAKGTTVNRYVRASVTAVSGSGSITFTVAFGRRGYASAGTAGSHRHFASLIQRSTSSTFEYGKEGNTAGQPKLTGEARLSSLAVTFSENDVEKFTATLMADGAVTETTF